MKYFWTDWLRNMCLFKCRTELLPENPLTVNELTSPKNSLYLQKSTFILLFGHSELKWVRKSYFLMRSEILGLPDNTLTANYEYSRSNRWSISEVIGSKRCAYLNASESFFLKISWNLQRSTFILLFLHSELNWVRRGYF